MSKAKIGRTTTCGSRRALAALAVAATGLLAAAGPAAAHGGDSSKIHGCFGATNGKVEIVGPNDACKSGETALDWPAVDTNTTYSAGTGLALSPANVFSVHEVPWSALTGVPDGLDDGDDVGGADGVAWEDIENIPAYLLDGDDDGSAAVTQHRNQLAANDFTPNESTDPVSFTKIKDLSSSGGGRILGSYVQDGTLETQDIANETLRSEDVANGTLRSEDVAFGTLLSEDIFNGTLLSEDVANGTLLSEDVANGTLQSEDVGDGAITTSKLPGAYSAGGTEVTLGAVTSEKIRDGGIQGRDLGPVVETVTDVVNPLSIPAGGRAAITMSGFFLGGVKTTDLVTVSPPAGLEAGLLFTGSDVLSNGVVTIYLNNVTAAAIDPAGQSWTVRYLNTNG